VEPVVHAFATYVALATEMAAVVVIAYGAMVAFVRLAAMLRSGRQPGTRKAIWRDFGMWLVLGLEFELASDIVRSVIAPTWPVIAQLAVIAVIRTFLNYFLEKDLEGQSI
jgi:uncharacterized membrane protein